MSLLTNIGRFEITLDQVNQYKAGSLVSGYLSLSSEQPGGHNVNVGSISITFSGRTTTSKHVRDIQSHRRTLQLFSYKSRLYDGPGQLYAPCRSTYGRISPLFPFSFTFPSDCGFSQTEDFEGAPFFNPDRNQPLPPSFTDDNSLGKASAVYELSAELLAPGFNGYYMEGSFLQRQPLNLYIQRSIQEPIVQYTLHSRSFVHQSLDFFPPAEREFHKRPKTVSQKLGLKPPSSGRYPKAAFKTTILMPSVAVIGQPLSLMLHIDHNTAQSTASTPPTIHLKRLQVWLRTETSICGMTHKALELDLAKDREQAVWTDVSVLAQKSFDKAMPRVEHLDLRKVVDLTLDTSLVPTFKTFNITRTYSLAVSARIECAGKDFHLWGFDFARCTLLPKDFSPGLPNYMMPPPIVVEGEDLTDDPPPPYEEVAETGRQIVVPREPNSPPGERRSHAGNNIAGSNASMMAAVAASSGAAATSVAPLPPPLEVVEEEEEAQAEQIVYPEPQTML